MSGFSLKVVEGGLKGEEFLLEQKGLCLVGRDKSCSISISRDKDVGLSRRHCLMIIDPPNIRIRDLFSTNGTYVNGHRLIPAPIGDIPEGENPNDRFLLDGDRISISNIVMEMHIIADIEATQDTSKLSLDTDALQNSQTTKTKLIEFARGKTRANSLIPEPNMIGADPVKEAEDGNIEETHLFLSLPITEPIPRPNRAMKNKKNEEESSDDKEKEDSENKNKITDNIKNKGKKMAEKPDMSIITGSASSEDNIAPAEPPIEPKPIEEEETPADKSLDSVPSSSESEPEKKPVSFIFGKKKEPEEEPAVEEKMEESTTEKAPPVMASAPEEKPPIVPPAPPPLPTPALDKREEEVVDAEPEPVIEKSEKPESTPQSIPEPVIEKSEKPEPLSPEAEADPVVPAAPPEPAKDELGRKRLFDSDKMKAMEDLAGTLAHDYNKQLTVVMGYTELLRNAKDPEKIQEYAETIFRSAQLSSELTQQLLMFASHDHDSGNSPVNLSDMMTEIVSVMKHTAGRKIAVSYVPSTDQRALYTKGNQLEIHDAILNIAINALDSIKGTGTISFRTQAVALNEKDVGELSFPVEAGDYVKITIKDSGSGIHNDDFERIFEPFFTTKKKEQALGMGLTVSYGVVKKHNGAIDVKSQSKGTLFEIYLPSTEKTNGDVVEATISKEKLEELKPTVLVIDDEDDMRSLITEMLTLVKTEVKACLDEKEALDKLREDPALYDLVIVNMQLPMRTEAETFKELKNIKSDVKVLFSSGYQPSTRSQEVIAIGGAAYLPTPYSADELYDAVYELLK